MLHRGRPERESSEGKTAWKAENRNVEYRFLMFAMVVYPLVVKARGKHDQFCNVQFFIKKEC